MKKCHFRDKFRISLKIQYGCQLERVSGCGREGVNVMRYTFKASIGLQFRKQQLPTMHMSFIIPCVIQHGEHGGNTGLTRCKRNTSGTCPEYSKLHFWLGNRYAKHHFNMKQQTIHWHFNNLSGIPLAKIILSYAQEFHKTCVPREFQQVFVDP